MMIFDKCSVLIVTIILTFSNSPLNGQKLERKVEKFIENKKSESPLVEKKVILEKSNGTSEQLIRDNRNVCGPQLLLCNMMGQNCGRSAPVRRRPRPYYYRARSRSGSLFTLPPLADFPNLPTLPTLPSLPALPPLPDLPPWPKVPGIPIPALPQIPKFPNIPAFPPLPLPAFPG